MHLITAFPTEPRWVETVTRRIRVFELTLEQNPPRALGQSRENLPCAGDESMQLEGKKTPLFPIRLVLSQAG